LEDSASSKFDLILLSDLVFNHSQHLALLKTCLSCISPPPPASNLQTSQSLALPDVDLTSQSTKSIQAPAVLCFFSHHRPKFVEADLGILSLADENGWNVEKVWEDKNAGVSPCFLSVQL
jgi:nicotinamide N-methyltransferase